MPMRVFCQALQVAAGVEKRLKSQVETGTSQGRILPCPRKADLANRGQGHKVVLRDARKCSFEAGAFSHSNWDDLCRTTRCGSCFRSS